jgi:hypothetical protein
MIINYNKGIPKWALPKIMESIKLGTEWITKKYPHIDFSKAIVNFSITRNGSNFWSKNGIVNVKVGHKIQYYIRHTVGLTTPRTGLNVGYVIATTSHLIHELTHYVQGVEGRKFSEIETTQNEIDFLREYDPYWYEKLIPVSTLVNN